MFVPFPKEAYKKFKYMHMQSFSVLSLKSHVISICTHTLTKFTEDL